MCFSATANFVGSGVLGTLGVVTLTKVKHRRELLFAALPALFALHQFIEGFVWLGLDGRLSPIVTHDMGAAYMLYAQGLLPFLLPLGVFFFEPNGRARTRMVPFLIIGGVTGLYILWALTAYPTRIFIQQNSIVYTNPGTAHMIIAILYVIATCGSLFFSKVRAMVVFGIVNLAILLDRRCGQAVRLHLGMVRVRGGRQCDRPRLLLEKQRTSPSPLRSGHIAAVDLSPILPHRTKCRITWLVASAATYASTPM